MKRLNVPLIKKKRKRSELLRFFVCEVFGAVLFDG